MDNSGSTVTVSDGDTTTTTTTSRGPGCGCLIAILVVLLLGGATTAFLAGTFLLRQETPTFPEAFGADIAVRTLMIDPAYKDWRMPARFKTADQLAKGKSLYGAQCALCHGQNGKANQADAQMGMTMFPPAADLTSERTRSKSDGDLYWLIWHGVNYTGMPAWGIENGGPNDQEEIWSMVAYIRSLQGQNIASK